MRIILPLIALCLLTDLNDAVWARVKLEQVSQRQTPEGHIASAFGGQIQEVSKSAEDTLCAAASRGDVTAVKALIAAGHDVDTRDKSGFTPLMLAAAKGHLGVVGELLAAGADPETKLANDNSALIMAAQSGHLEIVRALLAAGAKADGSNSGALRAAADGGHLETVNTLLAAGASPNARNFEGKTALIYAAARGDTMIVNALLTAGADLNAKDKEGMDALMTAAAQGNSELMIRLKAAGADVRSEQFALRIQDVARGLAKRLQEERVFGPVINEVFTQRFLDCHVRTMLEGQENAIFSQLGISLPPSVTVQAREGELQLYLIARLNFFHLKTLHRLNTRDLKGKLDPSFTAEKEFPPGTYQLLMKNPVIAAAMGPETEGRVSISIKSIQDLRQVLPTLEEAVSLMREYFIAHPPEESELYRKNIGYIGHSDQKERFWQIRMLKVSAKEADEMGSCFGFPVRVWTGIKVPPFYQLFVHQAGDQFRIGTLLCTEPLCVD